MTVLLIVIYLIFISLGLPDSIFGVAWPVVHQEFEIAEGFASFYSIITGVCTGGVSFISGWLLRKFGTGKVAFVSTLLTAVGLIGMSFAPNIVVMMVFAVILGYGAGVIDTGVNNFVSLHYEARHLNWLHCFWGLGVTVSPLIMSRFLSGDGLSWRGGYRTVALLQIIIALIILFSLPKWKKAESGNGSETSAQGEKSEKISIFKLLKTKGLITSILTMGCYCGMEFTLGTWGATYAVNTFAIAPDEAAKWASLYYLGIMLGRIISGFVSIKFSDNTIIRGAVVVTLAGILIFALPLGKLSLFSFLLMGIGFGPVFPSVLHSVPARFGTEYSADLTGFHLGGAYGIGFALQLVFGLAATNTTFKLMPFFMLALCLAKFLANEITIRKTGIRKSDKQ